MIDPEPHFRHGIGQRYKIVRSGTRAPISRYKWGLIWVRDGKRCVFCGSDGPLHLDHVIPWSAGGSDEASNLRVLCKPCNENRSNRKTIGDDNRCLPVVPSCFECRLQCGNPGIVESEDGYRGPDRSDWVPAYCAHCERTRVEPHDPADFEAFERLAVPLVTEERYRTFVRMDLWRRAVGALWLPDVLLETQPQPAAPEVVSAGIAACNEALDRARRDKEARSAGGDDVSL
jgi:hypothetical protein